MSSEKEAPAPTVAGNSKAGNGRKDQVELARLEFALRHFSAAKRECGNLGWPAGDDRALVAGIHCLEVWAELREHCHGRIEELVPWQTGSLEDQDAGNVAETVESARESSRSGRTRGVMAGQRLI
jgi:hypothetical protein